jgi:hypothetical protein
MINNFFYFFYIFSLTIQTLILRIIGIDIERKNRLLEVCYVPAASTTFLAFFSFFLAVAINSTNETNNAGDMCH